MIRLFCLILFVLGNLSAQNLTIGTAGMPLREMKTLTGKESPYFNDQFVRSKVTGQNNKGLTLEALRYNMVNQQVEYLNKDVVYEVQDSLNSFTITDSVGRLHMFEKRVVPAGPGFFEVLITGKLGLLKHYSGVERELQDWYTKKKVHAIVRTAEYYFEKEGKTQLFVPSRKNVLELMGDKAKDVKSYLNNNTPDFGNDESLKELFEFYNSLN